MAIWLEHGPGSTFKILQRSIHPVIHFDHWAINMFSKDRSLQARFVEALTRANGTLVLTDQNFAEFSLVTDQEQAERVEEFLNHVLPNIFVRSFLDNLTAIWGKIPAPPEDLPASWLLEGIGEHAAVKGPEITFTKFMTSIIGNTQISEAFQEQKQDIAAKVLENRTHAEQVEYARNFRPISGMKLGNILLGELLREATISSNFVFTPNDASDLIHAVSSCIYADLILLDGPWCHRVEVTRRRLHKAGVTRVLGKTYSQRTIHDFLTDLESRSRP